MSRPIEQSLTNLIPRHPGSLPPELVELASSLLAQSRSKCSNLKKDEEIARTYACANLACERLKTTLNLPPIEPRPPIPPRVYSKLYAYFNETLTFPLRKRNTQSQKSTPTKPPPVKRATPGSSKVKEKETPKWLHTHTQAQPLHANRAPKKGWKHKSNLEKESNIPVWLMPVVRSLCTKLETPKAIPHVLAGVESVLNLPEGENKVLVEGGKTAALVAAIWGFVVVKMRGKDGQGKETLERRKLVNGVINGAKEDEYVVRRVEGKEAWRGWDEFEERDVEVWQRALVEGGWREMDWYTNIEEGRGVEGVDGEAEGEENGDEDKIMGGKDEKGNKRRKVGMGDRYDYLSEENRAEYKEWKTMILAQIKKLKAGKAFDDEMDIDED